MTNIISLAAYRVRRAKAVPGNRQVADHLIEAANNLTAASRAFRDAVLRLESTARCLGRADPGELEIGDLAARSTFERLGQCKADCEEMTRLIDSADIDGCIRLRDAILDRARG